MIDDPYKGPLYHAKLKKEKKERGKKRKVKGKRSERGYAVQEKIFIWTLCLDSQVNHHDFRPSTKCAALAKPQTC